MVLIVLRGGTNDNAEASLLHFFYYLCNISCKVLFLNYVSVADKTKEHPVTDPGCAGTRFPLLLLLYSASMEGWVEV